MSKKAIGYLIRHGFIPYCEGVAEYTSVEGFGGITSEPTVNSLKKQGNYVIFNFDLVNSYGTDTSNIGMVKFSIPETFRPKAGTQVVGYLVTVGSTPTMTAFVGQVDENGEFFMGGTPIYSSIKIINAGWEIA